MKPLPQSLNTMFNITKFYEDHQIFYLTQGHKHCRPGWVQIPCPFCSGNPGYHLGFCTNKEEPYFNQFVCWRCGYKKRTQVIEKLLKIEWGHALQEEKKYSDGRPVSIEYKKWESNKTKLSLPVGTRTMNDRHRRYLRKRKFDPDTLEKVWDLKGTGPVGEYCHRIIAPIYFNKKLVSYQGRDITDLAEDKYRACRQENEVMHHKHILYGYDLVPKTSVVVVEGITDVWRLGPGAVCTFGIKYRKEQANLLSTFKNVFVMYDANETEACNKAQDLANDLNSCVNHVELITLEEADDPGDLDQGIADMIMKELIGRR